MVAQQLSTSTLPRDLVTNPRLSTWVSVTQDGHVGVRMGKVELGQGILTALAQIAADALGVTMSQIRMLPAHTTNGPNEGLTAGSMSVFDAGPSLRLVGAHVRALVLAEAARRCDVAVDPVRVEDGIVTAGSAQLSYAELLASVDLDVDVAVFDAPVDRARLVGTDAARIDLPDKVTGRPRYISDLRPDRLVFGRVVRPPSPGARLLDCDESLPGMTVVRDGSFLGLVGVDEAAVDLALEKLRGSASWTEQDLLPDEDDLVSFLREGPHDHFEVLDEPRVPNDSPVTTHRADYSRPFLAHASIAPSCGMAQWHDDGTLSVWSHSQGIHPLRSAIATAVGLDPDQVVVEHVENAGCYGHNAADDAAFDAVLLARAVPGRPVQVRWSRQDELGWAPFGSAMSTSLEATLTQDGRIASWTHDIWSQGHTARPGYAGVPGLLAGAHLAEPLSMPAAIDPPPAAGGGSTRNGVPIYDVGPRRVTGHRLTRTPIRSSALRALGAFTNVFSIESFMDELAFAAGADPLEFRLAHLSDERGRAVLEAAASAAGWGRQLPEGTGLGIGFARYKDKGAYCAVVAEVEAETDIRVRRLTVAVDVGLVVNPDGVRNQIEGGATQATSWTLKERVRFDRRRITSVDWETYPILGFSEAPVVDVHLLDRPSLPSVGAGEAAQGPTPAAIANAVTAALGVRVRDLPINADAVVRAIENESYIQ
ncbi:MAG: aldehyde oxidase and xanthine dehydrogenase, molybdopterin binding protein [Marmoricola sp.]|nr:aldehyde oxidase and xanthine dehydrogenase, molybdopterin binding protein [Marmoricola sp.]